MNSGNIVNMIGYYMWMYRFKFMGLFNLWNVLRIVYNKAKDGIIMI